MLSQLKDVIATSQFMLYEIELQTRNFQRSRVIVCQRCNGLTQPAAARRLKQILRCWRTTPAWRHNLRSRTARSILLEDDGRYEFWWNWSRLL